MPIEPLVQLGTIGGFAFAAGALFLIVRALFDAWRKGELVSRAIFNETIERLTAENTLLRKENRAMARQLVRLANLRAR